jgi:glucose-6-phosphate isomerase
LPIYNNGVSPQTLPAWEKLKTLANTIQNESIAGLFDKDKTRSQRFSVKCNELFLDYSKNLMNNQVLSSLFDLAHQSALGEHTRAMFAGDAINTSEQRAVLHTALRGHSEDGYSYQGKPLQCQIDQSLKQVAKISQQVREGSWLASTGQSVTDVVHLGVGGSDLGPRMACQALRSYAHKQITTHFVSNADGAEILSTLERLNAETTLIIIVSKSFSTQETMLNANTALDWLAQTLNLVQPQSSSHVIAVTADKEKAINFGIDPSRILQFEEWVGGRYSLWSSVGLSVSISIGYKNFKEMLDGARDMDIHFQETPYEQNMPVIMALIGIWYNNFLQAHTQAVIPYCERLALLPSYLQQLEMESNGKSVSLSDEHIPYATAPIIWGQTGTDGQHAFFQLLHQGTHYVPIDFIGFINDPSSNGQHHRFLLSNLLAQASALMTGKDAENVPAHKIYKGNKPSNILLIKELTPRNFGSLIALYEHKTFVQGSIWNINSYDQWGVELGKKMTEEVLKDDIDHNKSIDPSTLNLHNYIRQNQG